MLPLYINSDTRIRLDKLTNPTNDTYVNTAAVTMTLVDADGNNVVGAVAVAVDFIVGSNGRYEGYIPVAVDLGTPGTEFDLEMTIVSAYTDFRKMRCVAQYRGVR